MLNDNTQHHQTVEYDLPLKQMTGMVTSPNGPKKEATHVLFTMVICFTIPWKQMILWHLTGNNISGVVFKIYVYDVMDAIESPN